MISLHPGRAGLAAVSQQTTATLAPLPETQEGAQEFRLASQLREAGVNGCRTGDAVEGDRCEAHGHSYAGGVAVPPQRRQTSRPVLCSAYAVHMLFAICSVAFIVVPEQFQ